MRSALRRGDRRFFLSLLWIVVSACGSLWIAQYEATPGLESVVPHYGPARTLLIALHPNCPCSLASVRQLKQTLSATQPSLPLRALLYAHPDLPGDSPLLAELRQIPSAEIVKDAHGHLAQRLGLRTSGHLIAYGPGGEILFSGGLTAGRGLSWPSLGKDALAQILAGAASHPVRLPVYGCSLIGSAS